MLATLLTFATEAAEEESEPTLFYIVGGIAAVYAILLFAVGMRSERFPASDGAMRGVIALSVLVVAATMASAVISS